MAKLFPGGCLLGIVTWRQFGVVGGGCWRWYYVSCDIIFEIIPMSVRKHSRVSLLFILGGWSIRIKYEMFGPKIWVKSVRFIKFGWTWFINYLVNCEIWITCPEQAFLNKKDYVSLAVKFRKDWCCKYLSWKTWTHCLKMTQPILANIALLKASNFLMVSPLKPLGKQILVQEKRINNYFWWYYLFIKIFSQYYHMSNKSQLEDWKSW